MPIRNMPNGGVSVDVRTPAELEEALDCIREQVLRNFPEVEREEYVVLMDGALRAVDALVDPVPFRVTPLGVVDRAGRLL